MTDDKAAVLIDNSYLQKEVIDNLNGRNGKFQLDYQEFSNNLCREIGAERFRTYIYDVSLDSNKNFLTSLNLLDRFEIRSGKLQENDKGYRQKQVDILLAIDMIKLALKNKIQHIILITGDSDFVPAETYHFFHLNYQLLPFVDTSCLSILRLYHQSNFHKPDSWKDSMISSLIFLY